jgi:subtilase family serine protease
MRFLRSLPFCVFAATFITSTQAFPQKAAPARILERIDENQLVTLRGNTHPTAVPKNDLGLVRSGFPMTDLLLVLSRSAEQQAAFDRFVTDQYDPSSPNFRHWLRPAEVGEQFGPSFTDIATISNWLASRGFSVASVSKDRMTIRFSGTAAQVQAAFHTEIHSLSVDGQKHIANISDPEIPAALAPVVAGVKALHDFTPRPLHRLGAQATFDSATGGWKRAASENDAELLKTPTVSGAAHPELGITTGSSLVEDVTPYDFATIYNVQPLWNAGTRIDGTGQTIAITGTSDITPSDVASFRSVFGLPAGLAPIQVKGANGLDPGVCTSLTAACNIGDLIENSLDVEWSGAVAPGAQIVLVTSGALSSTDDTVYDSSDYVVENIGNSSSPVATAHILNVSYGQCELGMGTGGNVAYSNLWQTAAAEGIAVFVASGDAGAATCDQGMDVTVPYKAQFGVSVSGLASTPYNTAVGGTDFNWGSTASPYWNATNNSTTGASAAGYMPEIPWNDTCTNPLTLPYLQNVIVPALQKAGYSPTKPTDAESACQFVISWYMPLYNAYQVDISGFVDSVGGGGGVSACTTSDGNTVASCTGGYAKPSWQANVTGIPADGKRDLPDVSFFASNGFLGSAYLICVTAPGMSCLTSTSPTTEPITEEVGGTSVASPAMAGVMALINQKAGTPQGSPNAELYKLATLQNYASCKTEGGTVANGCYFNDIDTGTNATACAPGSPNCTVQHTGDTVAVLSGYSATTGFDPASGLGSLNVANVVNGWTSTTGTGTATVTVVPSATSITVAQALTVPVTVTGSGGTPTGTVVLVGGGFLGTLQTLAGGTSSFTIPAFGLAGGTYTLNASYGGDSNYAEASGAASVTVTKVAPTAISVTPASTTVAVNASLTVVGTVTGAGPAPTGSVTLAGGGYTSAATILVGSAYSIKIPANSLSIGSDTLTLTYSGDGIYATGTNTAAITVSPAPLYALTSTTPAAVTRGSAATSTITVTGTNGYTGMVALTCVLKAYPVGAGDLPTCSGGTVTLSSTTTSATATVTVTTTAATASLVRPDFGRNTTSLAGLGVTALALLALCGIPAQRRRWRSLLGMLALLVALGSLAACSGGGSSSGGGSGTKDPGTTSGLYTFTVTGSGSPVITPAPTATFTVTVN